MIEQLLKTYEHLPRQKGEEDRRLVVVGWSDEFEVKLTVYIHGKSHQSAQRISKLEYESLKRTDISDVLVKRVCRELSDYLEVKE